MITFEVRDMTCGHCVSALTRALQDADPGAQVQIDLASHRVQVEPAKASVQALADAITEAGYTPVPVDAAAPVASTSAGCCGGCR